MQTEVSRSVLAYVGEYAAPDAAGTLTTSMSFDDLGVDSMTMIDLVLRIERELDVAIPDDALNDIRLVQDIVDYVAAARA